MHLADIFS